MRVKTNIPEVDRALDPIWRELERRERETQPLGGGVLLSVSLSAGVAKRISHNLRRAWRGWLLVDTTGASPVYRANTANTDKSQEIYLQSAADTDVVIYLF